MHHVSANPVHCALAGRREMHPSPGADGIHRSLRAWVILHALRRQHISQRSKFEKRSKRDRHRRTAYNTGTVGHSYRSSLGRERRPRCSGARARLAGAVWMRAARSRTSGRTGTRGARIHGTNDGMPLVGEKDPGGQQKPILFPHPCQRVGQPCVITFHQRSPRRERFHSQEKVSVVEKRAA